MLGNNNSNDYINTTNNNNMSNENSAVEQVCYEPKRMKVIMQDSHNEGSFIQSSTAVKRIRDDCQQTPLISKYRTPKTSDSSFRLLQIMDKKIEKSNVNLQSSLDEIKNMIRESEKRVLAEFETKVNEMKFEISNLRERVSKVEEVAEEIHTLKAEIRDLKINSFNQENAVVACDIRINGIPFENNENLQAIVKCLCDVIQTPMPKFKMIYRLQNRNNTKQQNWNYNCKIHVPLRQKFLFEKFPPI